METRDVIVIDLENSLKLETGEQCLAVGMDWSLSSWMMNTSIIFHNPSLI